MFQNPMNEERAQILKKAKTIAVVGMSNNPERTSYLIAEAMQKEGFRIIPVNPMLKENILGEKPYASLREIPNQVDLVNVFRRSELVEPIVEDAIAIKAPVIWMQEGVYNEEAAQKAQANGITVIMDRCIKIDHAYYVKNRV